MILVRELRHEDDLSGVLRLCKDFFAEYGGHHSDFFEIEDLNDDDISGRFVESIDSDGGATIIALEDDAVIGYASVAVREQPHFYRVKEIGAIWGLMVAREHRREGIATGLIQEAKAFFRRKGIKYFTAYTAVANETAIKFYERNGMSALQTTLIGELD